MQHLNFKSPILDTLINLPPGKKVWVEMETLNQPDNTCIAANMALLDGPEKQCYPSQCFKLNKIVYAGTDQGAGTPDPGLPSLA